NAPIARSRRPSVMSPIDTVLRDSSPAIPFRTSDSDGPGASPPDDGRGAPPSGAGTRLPSRQGADDFGLAADPDDAALLDQEHGVAGGLAQLDHGTERGRDRRDRE